MTKLENHIPLEYMKQSKKLQEIWRDKYFMEKNDELEKHYKYHYILTIADVIDNAEMLFEFEYKIDRLNTLKEILWYCFYDKSIEEISEYILKNII